MAPGVNHTVRLPRARRPASYSAQLVTRCRCFGMWRRQAALALNGTARIQASGKGPSSYTAQLPTPTGRSVQQGGGFWQNMTPSTLPLPCFAEKQASLLSSLDSYDRRAPGREGNGGVGNYTTAHQIDQVKQDSALIEIGSGRHRNAVCYRINGPGENRIALSANALWIGVAAP